MTAFDNPETGKRGITLLVIFFIILLVISFLVGGVNGVFGVIKVLIYLIMIVTFIGVIVYLVWYLFIKNHPRNIPFENWKDYRDSAIDNGADMMDNLVLTGDSNHSSKEFMKIHGYLRVMGFDGDDYDMFVGKKSKLPFEEYKIVLLKPHLHTELIGDVYVKGISLIKKYGFYLLNQEMIDYEMVDTFVAKDTFRKLTYELMGDVKGIMDRATNIDPQFRKEQMQQKILKIPQLSGQEGK